MLRSGTAVTGVCLLLHVVVCQGEHGKFPDMCTLRIHFASILNRGFEAFREPLEVRFPAEADVIPGQPLSMILKSVSAASIQCC